MHFAVFENECGMCGTDKAPGNAASYTDWVSRAKLNVE